MIKQREMKTVGTLKGGKCIKEERSTEKGPEVGWVVILVRKLEMTPEKLTLEQQLEEDRHVSHHTDTQREMSQVEGQKGTKVIKTSVIWGDISVSRDQE